MEINELMTPDAIIPALRVTSKKQALQEISKRAAELIHLPERAIFEVLVERERLGTTGVGHGIAIPHGKLANIDRLYALFARLETPIDFDSIDEQPVDLICVLLAPETAGADHLKALARVSCSATRLPATSCAAARAPTRSTRCSPNRQPATPPRAPGLERRSLYSEVFRSDRPSRR